MPMNEFTRPIGATLVEAVKRGVTYPLEAGESTFTRTGGVDGSSIVLPLNNGDENIGDVLEGQWKKGWDANIATFTAIISSGSLKLGGLAAVAETWGSGWIDNQHPVIQCHGTELTAAMESPTSDTGATAARDIFFEFYLTKNKTVSSPKNDNDYLHWYFDVDEDGLICYIRKMVDSDLTVLFSGSTYDDTSARDPAADVVWIWRIVFHDGHYGESTPSDDRHMHVYLKTGSNLANAEAATEHELSTSPYDLSDLTHKVSFPAFRIQTEDDTNYFDQGGNEAIVHYFRATHPGFNLRHNITEANRGKGDVEIWDGDPDGTGVQVFDEDHEFAGDCFLRNNFLELQIDEGAQYGLILSYYTGAAWNQPLDRLYYELDIDSQNVSYPYLQKIVKVSKNKTIARVKMCEDAADDDDYFVTIDITFERGKRTFKVEFVEAYPQQDIIAYFFNSTTRRFGYVGDADLGDDDIGINGQNTTLSDNFLLELDNAGTAVIGVMFTNEKPLQGNTRFEAQDGGDLLIDSVDWTDFAATKIWYGLIPFALIACLYTCASAATADGGADTATPGVGEACAAVLRLDAQNEGAHWIRTAGTHLPEGRYLAIIRDYGVGGVQNYNARVYNNDDSEYRNEDAAYVTFQAQNAAWTYRKLVFDVTAADVTGTDAIWIQILQPNAGPNTVYIDYILLIPICNGEDWPQDLAHAAMRALDQPYRVRPR